MGIGGASTALVTGNPTRMQPRMYVSSSRRAAMQILPVMPFKMATTTTSWTRMVVRKGSNLKTYRYFGIFKNQPISHPSNEGSAGCGGNEGTTSSRAPSAYLSTPLTHRQHRACWTKPCGRFDPIVGLCDLFKKSKLVTRLHIFYPIKW